jgi:hypothetical protein
MKNKLVKLFKIPKNYDFFGISHVYVFYMFAKFHGEKTELVSY